MNTALLEAGRPEHQRILGRSERPSAASSGCTALAARGRVSPIREAPRALVPGLY